MAKRKKKQQSTAQPGEPKMFRVAHKIMDRLTALDLDEAIDVVAMLAEGLVLLSTPDDDPESRSCMIEDLQDRICDALTDIDPLADRDRLWLVPPQGAITEPFGILWDGYHDGAVKGLLGAELDHFRAEHAATTEIVEGVNGVAITVPDWDGEDTITCANPDCGRVHDVHLKVAEELFQLTIESRQKQLAVN